MRALLLLTRGSVSRSASQLRKANEFKKKKRTFMCWVVTVAIIIFVIIFMPVFVDVIDDDNR